MACVPSHELSSNLHSVFGLKPMNYLYLLVPLAILMGFVGLVAFLWSLVSGQYEDLDGAAERIFLNDDDKP